MENIVHRLRADYPQFIFTAGSIAHWSPSKGAVGYVANGTPEALWGLLHEVGHALLGHTSYTTDVSLIEKEVAAWEKAHELAAGYGFTIDDDHVQDCLDTYREWLHGRSTCPHCRLQGVQDTHKQYLCLNCKTTWLVSNERFCRPYRRSRSKQKTG